MVTSYSPGDANIIIGDPFGGIQQSSPGGGAAAASGPYDDIPNIVGAWGMRQLLSSYTDALIRLLRNSDDAEDDFGFDGNGDLDTAAIATFLGASAGYGKTVYDQFGTNHLTQTTKANMPLYVASGQNSRPVLRFQGVNDQLVSASTVPTIAEAMQTINFGATKESYESGLRLDAHVFMRATTTDNLYFSPSSVFGATDTQANMRINGVSSIAIPTTMALFNTRGTAVSNRTVRVGRDDGGGGWLVGDVSELIIASAQWSSGERAAAEAAANDYWAMY